MIRICLITPDAEGMVVVAASFLVLKVSDWMLGFLGEYVGGVWSWLTDQITL
jgi:hypothetical protein